MHYMIMKTVSVCSSSSCFFCFFLIMPGVEFCIKWKLSKYQAPPTHYLVSVVYQELQLFLRTHP